MGYGSWAPYVPVAERRARAEKEMAKLRKKGHPVAPVILEGRTIAGTFWGKAWCDNLESYQDYENRLPRGRTYVRNGSVVDLQIAPREVKAIVSGSSLYTVAVAIKPLPPAQWEAICRDCAGGIDSLVELLQGRFSKAVMERLCRQTDGLFPKPSEISFSCSCPDWAFLCKHVAAVLYGVGARLDRQPELLFRLRDVDESDLVSHLDRALPVARTAPAAEKLLAHDDLSALFGVDLAVPDEAVPTPEPAAAPKPAAGKATGRGKGPERRGKTTAAAPAGGPPVVVSAAPPTRQPRRRTTSPERSEPGPELTPDGFVKWWK